MNRWPVSLVIPVQWGDMDAFQHPCANGHPHCIGHPNMDAFQHPGTSGNPPAAKVYRTAKVIFSQPGIEGYMLGGFIVAMVPHHHLYEKRARPPSRWNPDHYQFYTPAKLLATFEDLLPPNCYRIRHLADNDRDFNYEDGPDKLPSGCYEIELCIQKIAHPGWVWPA